MDCSSILSIIIQLSHIFMNISISETFSNLLSSLTEVVVTTLRASNYVIVVFEKLKSINNLPIGFKK